MPTDIFLAIVLFFNSVPDTGLVAENLTETSYIFTAPAAVHFAILAKLAAHQVELRFNTNHLEAIGQQLYKHITRNLLLRAFEEGLDIAHDGVHDLSFV